MIGRNSIAFDRLRFGIIVVVVLLFTCFTVAASDRLRLDERRPNLEGRLTVHGSLFLGVEPRIARHGAS
jgi:hypothetical protein